METNTIAMIITLIILSSSLVVLYFRSTENIKKCNEPCWPYITLVCNEEYYICANNNEKAIWFNKEKENK